MTVRQRTRRTQDQTVDREWLARREYVIAYQRDLELAEVFWEREPGIPDELRRPASQRWHMAVHQEDIDRLKAEYDAHLEARRDWLRSNGWGEYAGEAP